MKFVLRMFKPKKMFELTSFFSTLIKCLHDQNILDNLTIAQNTVMILGGTASNLTGYQNCLHFFKRVFTCKF